MIKPVTSLATLTDFAALQDDLATMLLAHPLLQQVNVTQERKFLLDSDLNISALWQTPRNNGSGMGIIVEDLRPLVEDENTPGPICNLNCGFVVLGERNLAQTPQAGCLLHPEQIEQIIVDLFHHKTIQPYGQMRASGRCGEPANDWIDDRTGVYARRVILKLLNARKQTDTCDLVTISQNSGTITITTTCADPEVKIFFTLDGSCPANDPAINPQTMSYTIPFTAPTGSVVRAAAFAPSLNQSAVKQLMVL